jgi:hypothetical protein
MKGTREVGLKMRVSFTNKRKRHEGKVIEEVCKAQ